MPGNKTKAAKRNHHHPPSTTGKKTGWGKFGQALIRRKKGEQKKGRPSNRDWISGSKSPPQFPRESLVCVEDSRQLGSVGTTFQWVWPGMAGRNHSL